MKLLIKRSAHHPECWELISGFIDIENARWVPVEFTAEPGELKDALLKQDDGHWFMLSDPKKGRPFKLQEIKLESFIL